MHRPRLPHRRVPVAALLLAAWSAWSHVFAAPEAVKQQPSAALTALPTNATPVITGPEKKNGFEVYTIASGYQRGPCELFVLLPEGFDRARQYPVLYLLPCWAGGSAGLDEVKKLGLASRYGVICVNPAYSTYPSPWGPWYGDLPSDSSVRCDSYLTEVIVPFIDRIYPTITKPEGRLLVGYSKAGLGALTVFLRHPDIFGREASWDAPLLMGDDHQDYWGPPENWATNYSVSFLLNQRLDLLKGKPARIAIAGPGPKGGMTGRSGAHELLDKLGIAHYYNTALGGDHAWTSGWLGPLVEVLRSEDMAKALPAVAPATPRK